MGGAVKKIGKSVKSAAKSVGHGLGKFTKTLGKSINDSFNLSLESAKQSLTNPFRAVGTHIKGIVRDVEGDTTELFGKKIGQSALPVAIQIVGYINPALGAALQGSYTYAKGGSPKDIAINIGAQYAGQKAGSLVGQTTGSSLAASGAAGFTRGATSGLLHGQDLETSLKKGASSGLTNIGVQALLGSQDRSPLATFGRQLAGQYISQKTNDLFGLGPDKMSGVSLQSKFAGTPSPTSPASANAPLASSGPATLTGGAIDITGSDVNAPRTNMWNTESLKLKDALGA